MAIMINGTSIMDDAYFTRDTKLGAPFRLGKHCWQTVQVEVAAVASKGNQSDPTKKLRHPALMDVGGFIALLDTGAGPNLICRTALAQLKPNYEIVPDTNTYTTANNQELTTYGRVEEIPIRIGKHTLPFTAVVVDELADEHMILGREFITMYDVLIDLPRQELVVRNPERKYELERRIEEDETAPVFTARANRTEKIPEESIRAIDYRVSPPRKRRVNNELASWLGVVTKGESNATKLMDAGIGLPNELVVVTGNKTTVRLLNTKEVPTGPEQDAMEVEPEMKRHATDAKARLAIETSKIRIQPVRVVYVKTVEKGLPEDPEQDNIHISVPTNTISVIRVNQRQDPNSDFDSANDSEMPIALPEKAPTAFPTRPDVENCRKLCTKKEFKRLNHILDKYEGVFIKNKTDIGLTNVVKHDIVLKPDDKYFREAPHPGEEEGSRRNDQGVAERWCVMLL